MALTNVEILRAILPNIGLPQNPDGSYRIGVEDVNSDEILAALLAIEIDTTLLQKATVVTPTTGAGTAIATLNPVADFHFSGLTLHIGSALAPGETLTVTLSANAGNAYDTVLFTQDMGTPDIRDVVLDYEGKLYDFVSGDQIVIALSANVGADTWGCQTKHYLR